MDGIIGIMASYRIVATAAPLLLRLSRTSMSQWRIQGHRGRTAAQALAWLGPVAALGLTWLLWPVMAHNPFLLFFGVVVLSAWYGGLRAGGLALGLSVVLLYLLLSVQEGQWWPDGIELGRFGLFVLISLVVCGFSEGHHRAERARRRSDAQLAKLFAAASEAIVITDGDGNIANINNRAEQMFGYDPDELVGQKVEILLPATMREQHVVHRADYAAHPETRSMGSGRDLYAQHKNGTTFPVEVSLSYVRDEAGLTVMALVTDITHRKEAERTIRDHQQRLQDMAFELAMARQREARRIAVELHDRLGQDLALAQIKLAGFQQELDRGLDTQSLNEGIELVEQAIENTRTLTFELCPPLLYDLGLEAGISALADEMQVRRGLRVRTESDGAAASVRGERACLLYRIVRELLTNVAKHAGVDVVTVELGQSGDRLRIAVVDEGVGFDPNEVVRRDRECGGFGLFSIREQMERLGGALQMDATPGRGARVGIEVPMADDRITEPTGEGDGNTCAAGR